MIAIRFGPIQDDLGGRVRRCCQRNPYGLAGTNARQSRRSPELIHHRIGKRGSLVPAAGSISWVN